MSKHFEQLQEELKTEALKNAELDLEKVDYEYRSRVNSAVHWRAIDSALLSSIRVLGERLSKLLTENDSEHSPYDQNDFVAAQNLIREFGDEIKEIHDKKRYRGGDQYPPEWEDFETGSLRRVLNEVCSKIEVKRQVFKSQRSFLKWAWGDLKHRVWSGGLLLVGAILSQMGSHWGPKILEYFARP